MSRHRPASETRGRHRSSRRRSEERGSRGSEMLTRPYVLEWYAQTCRQRDISTLEELRDEMGIPEKNGWRRLVVMRGSEGDMDGIPGVEFADGRSRRRRRTAWALEYPEMEYKEYTPSEQASNAAKEQQQDGGSEEQGQKRDSRQEIRLCRAALSSNTRIPILLIDGLPPPVAPRPSHRSRRRTQSSSGRPYPPDSNPPNAKYQLDRSELELSLLDILGDSRGLEDILSELAYDSWLDVLDALPPRESDSVEVLWALVQAIESNADTMKRIERQAGNVSNSGVTSDDWADLANRLHRRMQLSVSMVVRTSQGGTGDGFKDSNSRRLDRITYLGGILLPLTIVSGVLSINGSYGPGEPQFWVFWVASALCSVLTILVIYADHLRGLDVWMEVAATEVFEMGPSGGGGGLHVLRHHHRRRGRHRQARDDGIEATSNTGSSGEARIASAPDGAVYVVQRREDGTNGRAWRRRELGWAGAMLKMSGWYRWRGSPGLEFRMPGRWEEKMSNLLYS